MEKKQIMEDAVRNLTEHALQKRREQAGENGDTLTDQVRELSTKVKTILKGLPEEERLVLTEFYEKKEIAADQDCQYLYIQGAKDCTELLKMLGVL